MKVLVENGTIASFSADGEFTVMVVGGQAVVSKSYGICHQTETKNLVDVIPEHLVEAARDMITNMKDWDVKFEGSNVSILRQFKEGHLMPFEKDYKVLSIIDDTVKSMIKSVYGEVLESISQHFMHESISNQENMKSRMISILRDFDYMRVNAKHELPFEVMILVKLGLAIAHTYRSFYE